MSKGSNFWGTARGRLGNMVISSIKGQQVERKYQPIVANPKTYAQMRQRSIFASAVKFYRHSQQNLFKFAYEDKGVRESDYNAFMRHNVQYFTPEHKVACDNPTLPALGFSLALQLSYGSLPSPIGMGYSNTQTSSALFGFDLGAVIDNKTPDVYTWGEVSKAIIKGNNLQNGDIVTFLVIRTNMTADKFDEVIIKGIDATAAAKPAVWAITQKVIDSESTDDVTAGVYQKSWFGVNSGITTAPNDNLYFGSVIFSRNIQGQKLMVSTGTLACSQASSYLQKLPQKGSLSEETILQTWGANPGAILQGALV